MLLRGTRPQESSTDVSDWEARPIRDTHLGCGENDEGGKGGGGACGVISFRKMRHPFYPSHCGSMLLSFMVNDDHQQTPPLYSNINQRLIGVSLCLEQ